MLCADLEGGRFVTLFYGVLDPANAAVTYASAGQGPPLVFESRSRVFRELCSTGLPAGIAADARFPTGAPVTLAPGDVLVMATDGVTEAMNPAREEFGHERLRSAIQQHHTQSAGQLIQTIYREVRAFCGDVSQHDDITVVVVKALPR